MRQHRLGALGLRRRRLGGALEHLHNSITPPKSLHDDLAREIWRGEQFVEKEAHEVVHEAEVVEHFIAKEAR